MWNHRLARLKVELGAVQKDRNNVRFERDQAGNPTNFRIGFAIRPSRKPRVADVVVAAEAFVGTKGLCSYYDIGDARFAGWSYREAYPEVGRISGLISFEPDVVSVFLDGTQLHLEPGQAVIPHGPDRELSIVEATPRQ